MSRFLRKLLNSALSLIMAVVLLVSGSYAVYALWDNSRVYAGALDVQADMRKLKPVIDESEQEKGPSFEDLIAVNPDVCAWVTLDNTMVDHPVLQGENNLSYINTNVYGEFALAGSIFLDSRCSREFADRYQLLYGHHMANHGMFGDLDLYKDADFFAENRTGTLIVTGKVYDLEIFACLVEGASEDVIFDPHQWRRNIHGLLDYVRTDEATLYLREDVIQAILDEEEEIGKAGSEDEMPKILALSTCSSEFTDARTVLLTVMRENAPDREQD